jgi:Kef-type K+ transport system membrane component KefB
MDRLADFFPDLLVIASLIVAAVGLAPLASKIGLPGPAAFLAVGLGAGLLGIVPTDELGPVALEEIGALPYTRLSSRVDSPPGSAVG